MLAFRQGYTRHEIKALLPLISEVPLFLHQVYLYRFLPLFQGVISLAGVYDLHCLNAKILKQIYLVPNFGEHQQTWRKASPFHQVKKSKTTRRPKFLLMNAELDPVLVEQSHAFAEKLTNTGLDCKHVTVHGSNHFTIVTNLVRIFGENDQSVLKLTVDFIFKN